MKMNPVKCVVRIAIALVVLVVAAVLTVPLWIGPVVTGVANSTVPKITKTGFRLGEFGLNPYGGTLHIGDLNLQNPERFFGGEVKEQAAEGVLGAVTGTIGKVVDKAGDLVLSSSTNAVSLAALDVSLSPLSVLSDTISIREIVVRDLYIYGDLTFSNIREITANASAPAEGEEAAAEPEPAPSAEEAPAEAGKGGKKVVIDRILITGTRFKWGHVAVSLPDIELKDVGKDEAVDEEGAFRKVLEAICEAGDKAQAGLGTALKVAIESGEALGRGVGAVAGAVVDGVGTAAGAVADGVGTAAGVAKDTAGALVEGVGAAAGAAKDTAGAAVDAVKGLFK